MEAWLSRLSTDRSLYGTRHPKPHSKPTFACEGLILPASTHMQRPAHMSVLCAAWRSRLITDLPIRSRKDAIEKLEWYALRWKIEVFHKIVKSGCKAEEAKLRTAQRLANLISVFCILSWRIFWMTMHNRSAPDSPPHLALTEDEIGLLDHLMKDTCSITS